MMYSSLQVANTILEMVFSQKRRMTEPELQRVLYITASEYHKKTNTPLLASLFATWSHGAVNVEVRDHYSHLGKTTTISDYYWNDAHRSLTYPNEQLQRIIAETLSATEDYSYDELSDILTAPGSAWHKSFVVGRSYLDNDDIYRDKSYLELFPYHNNDNVIDIAPLIAMRNKQSQ